MSEKSVQLKPLRLKYVVLPVALMVLGLILTAIYVWQMPETIYIQFNTEGIGIREGSPWQATLIWIGSTVLIVALCVLFTRFLATRPFLTNENVIMKPENLITLMGNIPAVASAVLIYAYWDICVYNLNGTHFIPLWVFALIVLGISALLLLFFMGRPLLGSLGKDLYGLKQLDQKELDQKEESDNLT